MYLCEVRSQHAVMDVLMMLHTHTHTHTNCANPTNPGVKFPLCVSNILRCNKPNIIVFCVLQIALCEFFV